MGMLSNAKFLDIFGPLPYTDSSKGDGRIDIDPKWVADNIVTLHTVLIPNIRCHVKIAKQLAGALSAVHLRGLGGLIKTFDGMFVPRHIQWNLRKGLSRHSWGVAIDLNAATNAQGKYNRELEPVAAVMSDRKSVV